MDSSDMLCLLATIQICQTRVSLQAHQTCRAQDRPCLWHPHSTSPAPFIPLQMSGVLQPFWFTGLAELAVQPSERSCRSQHRSVGTCESQPATLWVIGGAYPQAWLRDRALRLISLAAGVEQRRKVQRTGGKCTIERSLPEFCCHHL